MVNKLHKLSPSDFKFLWEECKYCYYQKIVNKKPRPFSPFPSVFTQINNLIQNLAMGMNLKDLHPDLPSGLIIQSEGWVESVPVSSSKTCFISGKFDLLAKLEDGTYCLIDLKISNPKDDDIYKYGNQLHAYKFALENPAAKAPIKISRMGLLVIHPESVELIGGRITLDNNSTWIEIEDDMATFHKFIDEVSVVINGDAPLPSENCGFCKYRTLFLESKLLTEEVDDLPF